MLVAWEFPKDNQFQTIAQDIPEAVKYTSLWATRDVHRIRDSKIFWVFMEMNIGMGINCKLWLSPTIYNSLQSFVEFKADFHHVYIKAGKDPVKAWKELPYLATDDVIFTMLESWLPEWCAPASSTVEENKSVVQRKKDKAKLHMAQLAEK